MLLGPLFLCPVGCTTPERDDEAAALRNWASEAEDQTGNVNQLIDSQRQRLEAVRKEEGYSPKAGEIESELDRLIALRRHLEDDQARIWRQVRRQ